MFFEDIFGGGGFPGGAFGGMPGGPRKPKGDTTKLYKTLGVDPKATQQEIRKAYRKLARVHHPDRGGDEAKFKEVQNAYDVLSDADKRKAYDETGDPNADPRSMRHMKKRKGKTTKFDLDVPLEQFYNGHTRRIRVTKTVVCSTCDGQGGFGVTTCTPCHGRGIRIIDRQIHPGMIQRCQVSCQMCDGTGQIIPRGQRCKECNANGTKKASSVLSVHIEKGMRPGEKITFSEEGDQHPDTSPGDVVVILRKSKKRHPVFTRSPDGCHLIVKRKISLIEALTGFSFNLTHLDGRVLVIKSNPNCIYKTGTIQALRDEGMPLRGDISTRGHIYIDHEVIFPTGLSDQQKKALQAVLGTPESPAPVDEKESETFVLERVDLEAEKRAYAKLLEENPNQYEEDDDEGGEPGQVACRSQ